MIPTQDKRSISVETPLGKDALLLHSFTYHEELGRPFEMVLEMQSMNPMIDSDKILGQKVTVSADLPVVGKRYFNGYVRDFEMTGYDTLASLASYRAIVVPWLSLLKLSTDCRTFQGKSIPDILREVFSQFGFSDHRFNLTHLYVPREFCVQYRESAFDFVSRLMEFAGIYYYFEHKEGNHTLVLCDAPSAHTPDLQYAVIPYKPTGVSLIGGVREWMVRETLCPDKVVLDDYDYTQPKTSLRVSGDTTSEDDSKSRLEYFDAPGGFQDKAEGEGYARIRHEEMVCEKSSRRGSGDLLGISAGRRFTLLGHMRLDQNAEYLVTSADLEITTPPFSKEQGELVQSQQTCSFSAIPATIPFRPKRTTPKPKIAGLQTAVVTGSLLQKVEPSSLGSVRVQFRWDRYSKGDQDSSVWIRVAQFSAGKGWGSMFIPHIGNEVAVAFEEGDPDRPVIIGSLYNYVNMPPIPLPLKKELSCIVDSTNNSLLMKGVQGMEAMSMVTPYQQTQFSIGCGAAPASTISPDESSLMLV
jgi:type VI secretion system secreted protein VgrG